MILLLLIGLSFPQLLDRVVANVNGEPILESELKVARIFYGAVDRRELINMLVEKHLIAQFLRENGMNVPEAYIDQVVKEIAESNGRSLEELYEDLRREGLTPDDLRSFLRVEITATLGLREYLRNRIEVSEIEIELERLRKGEVDYLREIELLIIPASKKEKVLEAVSEKGSDLQEIAKSLGLKTERLRVKRGELVEPLDREVWRTPKGELTVAEDGEHLYLAKVLREVRVFSGRSEEEIREEILRKKIEREREEIVRKLRRERFVEIYG
ncbi:MAG TPA: peptidylprolyl isomerase [Aquifex aeolicus]|uniref:Peptidylprolyl isomerase n=1 Tax=Aquifex aeolicus TaxID=63363 RepID=A0A7C5Q8U5_AQUAO|nr:peptidylprolyl isomerase [Aquifex aeolicus]